MKHNYISLLCFIFITVCIFSYSVNVSRAEELGISVTYANNNQMPIARIELTIAAPYHAYSHTPGNTGKPTVLTIQSVGTPKVQASVRYPQGILQRDVFTPTQMVHVYEGHVSLFVDLPHARAGQEFLAQVDTLLCSDKHCLPLKQNFTLRLPEKSLPPLQKLPWAAAYAAARHGQMGHITPSSLKSVEQSTPPSVPFAAIPSSSHSAPLPLIPLQKSPSIPLSTSSVELLQGGESGISAITTTATDASSAWAFTPRYFEESIEVTGLLKAVVLGLLAGLLLNVMPCVLPVLTMKASAILLVGNEDKHERFRRFREHNILFAAGIMTLFLFLALVLGTAGMIWGQLFQNPWIITGMLAMVFLLGLSMLGVFTLPVIDLKAARSSSPRLQAYFTGIIATLLATPCSGPLLGGVLGWAFMQPLPVLITVFLAVGLGMSAPYLLFALRPQLVSVLPKPGAWMGVLEKLVGFFLLGTSVYLLSILPATVYIPTLSVLLTVALCAWLYGRYASYDAPPRRRFAIMLGSVLGIALVVYVALWPTSTVTRWESFSPAAFTEILGREPMVVEFTADWCPNCKLLEQSTLTPANLQRWHERYAVRFIRVDLTREDAAAQQFLQSLGSSSIPLTALFPVGAEAAAPLVLRDIYSTGTMDTAMEKLFLPQK